MSRTRTGDSLRFSAADAGGNGGNAPVECAIHAMLPVLPANMATHMCPLVSKIGSRFCCRATLSAKGRDCIVPATGCCTRYIKREGSRSAAAPGLPVTAAESAAARQHGSVATDSNCVTAKVSLHCDWLLEKSSLSRRVQGYGTQYLKEGRILAGSCTTC
jgi:hypothetical protein